MIVRILTKGLLPVLLVLVLDYHVLTTKGSSGIGAGGSGNGGRGIVTVKRGREAFLHPRDVGVIPQEDELCKVQVVNNDPATQRAGKIVPEVFDCNFALNTVKYIHHGSPFLDEDLVKLKVFLFRPTSTVEDTVSIRFKVAIARCEVIVQDPRLRSLEVNKYYGLSSPIDPSVLRFRYNYYEGATCTVHFNKHETKYPMFGQIVRGKDKTIVDNMTADCREFLYMGLRYQHLHPPSPDLDYLPIMVESIDPNKRQGVLREYLYLPIRITGAMVNTPPIAISSDTHFLEVEQYELAELDPHVLSAEDSETSDAELVFNLTRKLTNDQGFLVHKDDPTIPITSFKQYDLTNHKIAYHSPIFHLKQRAIVSLEFIVFDSHFMQSDIVVYNIRIHPTSIMSPKVSINKGLTLIEGKHRPITQEDLQILDSDNPQDVRMYVKGGLWHGKVKMDGLQVVMFSLSDLESERLTYDHDGDDSTKDNIMIHVTDHHFENFTRIDFPIRILPVDDKFPYLDNNVGLSVTAGSQVLITDAILSAHDVDSEDDQITFVIRDPPTEGKLVRKHRPMTAGQEVSSFTQLELSMGLIFYQHGGGLKQTDSFQFRLHDNNTPPNKSGKYGVAITVLPPTDMMPRVMPGSSQQLLVHETDVAHITKDNLQYMDGETVDNDLLYTITTQPFFLTTTITIDAGRIISTENITMLLKDPSISALHTFRQRDIVNGKVAYMPPIEDIGPIRRHARFLFTVSDSHGNKVMDQPFDITILPVNNQLPHISTRRITVVEGRSTKVTGNDITAYDPDTDQDELRFIMEDAPKYGHLFKEDVAMLVGEDFSLNDLVRDKLRYIHDGSDVTEDSFSLSVSDGVNKVTKQVPIQVNLVNDHHPQPLNNLRRALVVPEGGELLLTSANIAATDNDTDDQNLNFVLMKSPRNGEFQVRGRKVLQFSQAEVWNRLVRYVHTSGEIGTDSVRDSASFAVTDQAFGGVTNTAMIDINITITPVDNQPPHIILGAHKFVEEGHSFAFTSEDLGAHDMDTHLKDLTFIISNPPSLGHIVCTHEDCDDTPLDRFSAMNLAEKIISYHQYNHTGIEPLSDEFEVYVTDGIHDSAIGTMEVMITPINDEIPQLNLGDFVVELGGEIIMDQHDIDASDADLPPERLVLSVAQNPEHGKLYLVRSLNEDTREETDMREITMEDIYKYVEVMYRHDGSDFDKDQFTLQVTDGHHTAKSTATISVRTMNDKSSLLTRTPRLRVRYGGSELLRPSMFQQQETDWDSSSIQYFILSVPDKGVVQIKADNDQSSTQDDDINYSWIDLTTDSNFSHVDVELGNVRYKHIGGIGDTGFDSFIFMSSDGHRKFPKEAFDIEVMGPKAKDISIVSKGMEIKEGDSKIITNDLLNAMDSNSKPQDLVFYITRPPRQGHLGLATEKNTPISSFTQLDLETHKIVYTHTSKADFAEDTFYFNVVNTFNATRSGAFKISIDSKDIELPSLITNLALTVVQGEETTLTSDNLKITDPDTATFNLTYILTSIPQHGQLLRKGVVIQEQFSQNDIDNGFIAYRSYKDDDFGMDFFLYQISDGVHDGYLTNGTLTISPAFYNILIQPLAKEPPRLVNNVMPTLLENLGKDRFGFRITSDHLKSTHPIDNNVKLTYTMKIKPQHGHLHNTENQRPVKKRFRQKDVDQGNIVYILNDDANVATNDSFLFRVQDVNRNTLDNQIFSFEWSVIQLAQSQMIVCEDADVLTVMATREGALNQAASVEILTKGLSARETIDYIPSSTLTLNFPENENIVKWDIHIVQDDEEEPTEKFKVQLNDASNAIIGPRDKATITIVSYENGKCEEYIGMISKDNREPIITYEPPGGSDSAQNKFDDEITLPEGKGLGSLGFGDSSRSSKKAKNDDDTDDDDFDIFKDYVIEDVTPNPSSRDIFGNLNGKQLESDAAVIRSTVKPKSYGEPLEVFHREDFDIFDQELREPVIEPESDVLRKGGRGKKPKKNRKNSPMERQPVDSSDDTIELRNAPQPCTKDTDGLLYFDFLTARMFRCNGQDWDLWVPNQVYLKDDASNRMPDPDVTLNDNGKKKIVNGSVKSSGKDSNNWDAEPCPPDWYRYEEGCYKLAQSRFTWEDSEKACEDLGGHLTHIESIKHLEWLTKLQNEESFWIGLNDKRLHHVWEYSNGQEVKFFHWRRGFPRSQTSLAKNCVLVSRKMEWVNRPCDQNTARFVCYRSVPHNVRNNGGSSNRRRRRRRRRHHEHIHNVHNL